MTDASGGASAYPTPDLPAERSQRIREEQEERTPVWLGLLADYIAEWDLPTADIEDGRTYTAEQMLGAHVYRILAELDSYHDLHSHLGTYPQVRGALGFDDVPSHDTLRAWWTERLDDGRRTVVESLCEYVYKDRLEVEFRKLGLPEYRIFRDTTLPDPDPDEITPEQKQTAIDHIRPMMYEALGFGRAQNITFPREQLLDLQSEVSREQDFIQKTVEEHWARGDSMPTPRAYFGAIKNREPEEWRETFGDIFDRQIRAAKGAGMFSRPVDVYIDTTVIPFYIDRSAGVPEGVRGGESKAGTNYGYHWTTISAHDNGRSILLACTPSFVGDSTKENVEYLVEEASKHVNISGVYMDSAFRGAELLQWLDGEGHDFMVQFPRKGRRLKLALARMTGKFDTHEGYVIQSADKQTRLDDLTVVAEPDYNNVDGDFDFATNTTDGQHSLDMFNAGLDWNAVDLDDIDDRHWKGRRAYLTNADLGEGGAEGAIRRYKKRWTIETKYRVIKHEFLAKTTSRDYSVRTFFWHFACMLYNAWVLLDVFLRADYPELAPPDRPVMPARSFAKLFFKGETEYG